MRCSAALAPHLPALRATGAAAGLHVLAWLPDGLDEARITADGGAGRDRDLRRHAAPRGARARRG